jgi:hypothetical protein
MFQILISLSSNNNIFGEPVFLDPVYKYKLVAEGLSDPTGIVFIDNDILI